MSETQSLKVAKNRSNYSGLKIVVFCLTLIIVLGGGLSLWISSNFDRHVRALRKEIAQFRSSKPNKRLTSRKTKLKQGMNAAEDYCGMLWAFTRLDSWSTNPPKMRKSALSRKLGQNPVSVNDDLQAHLSQITQYLKKQLNPNHPDPNVASAMLPGAKLTRRQRAKLKKLGKQPKPLNPLTALVIPKTLRQDYDLISPLKQHIYAAQECDHCLWEAQVEHGVEAEIPNLLVCKHMAYILQHESRCARDFAESLKNLEAISCFATDIAGNENLTCCMIAIAMHCVALDGVGELLNRDLSEQQTQEVMEYLTYIPRIEFQRTLHGEYLAGKATLVAMQISGDTEDEDHKVFVVKRPEPKSLSESNLFKSAWVQWELSGYQKYYRKQSKALELKGQQSSAELAKIYSELEGSYYWFARMFLPNTEAGQKYVHLLQSRIDCLKLLTASKLYLLKNKRLPTKITQLKLYLPDNKLPLDPATGNASYVFKATKERVTTLSSAKNSGFQFSLYRTEHNPIKDLVKQFR